jgi:predicted 3-demethylubiquinone-9 3-methyltransferase (glyoxalase superfamily)
MESKIIAQKITPNLWFDRQAEEAVNFYVSIFKNTRIGRVAHYGKAGHDTHGMPEGTVMTMEFELDGQKFVALNGGPHFKFNEAISFIVSCGSQQEIDEYWDKLGQGGNEKDHVCGWLKDKYGLSWQVVPTVMTEWLLDPDQRKAGNVMNALLKMKKIDLSVLQAAYES